MSSSPLYRQRYGGRNGVISDKSMIEVDAYVKDLASSTQPTFTRLSRATLRCDLELNSVDSSAFPERRGMRPANHFDLTRSEIRTDHLVLRGKFARLPLCVRGHSVSLDASNPWIDIVDVATKMSLPNLAWLHPLADDWEPGMGPDASVDASDAESAIHSTTSTAPNAEVGRSDNHDANMNDKNEEHALSGAERRALVSDDALFVDPSAVVDSLLVHANKPDSFRLLDPLTIDYAPKSLSTDDIVELESLIAELESAELLSESCRHTLDAVRAHCVFVLFRRIS